jgi:putative oxidoreductase
MPNGKMQSWGLTVLRVVVGVVFLAHGYQKFFKFGHHGVTGMLAHMGVPLPSFFAAVLMVVEFVGGILLIAGVAVRVVAALIAIDMLVAILLVHAKNGFFNPGGVEFPLTLLAAAVCLALAGGGAFSVKR